jgi:hypothetical protein
MKERPRGKIGKIGGEVETPYGAAVNALEVLSIGFLIHDATEEGRINESLLANPLVVRNNGDSASFRKTFAPGQIKIATWNLMMRRLPSARSHLTELSMTSLGPKTPHLEDPISSARAIVYQLRNSFAHHPFKPRWDIKGKYLRRWVVAEALVELDAPAVNGKPLQPGHFGPHGIIGYLKLIEWCTDRLAERETAQRK